MATELSNVLDIQILQNQTFNMVLFLNNDDESPINLTNWSFTGSIKEKYSDIQPIMFFTASIIEPASGSLRLYLAADQTWMLTGSRYVYDVIGNNTNQNPVETLRIMQGKVIQRPGVTEP